LGWGCCKYHTSLFSLFLAIGTANMENSICIITLVRITKAYTLDFHDLPYSAARAVMVAVPEPVLSLVAGCIPIMVPLFRRATNKLRSATSTIRTAPPSYESRAGMLAKQHGSTSLSDARKQQRLDDHLYPMGSVVDTTSLNGSVVASPSSPLRGFTSTESFMSGWGGMGRSTDGFSSEAAGSGITVLTEVHIDSKSRNYLESMF
jgi:hypothetical protein